MGSTDPPCLQPLKDQETHLFLHGVSHTTPPPCPVASSIEACRIVTPVTKTTPRALFSLTWQQRPCSLSPWHSCPCALIYVLLCGLHFSLRPASFKVECAYFGHPCIPSTHHSRIQIFAAGINLWINWIRWVETVISHYQHSLSIILTQDGAVYT